MSGPSGEACERCYYYCADIEAPGYGLCYRYPPKIHTTKIYLKDENDEAGFPEPASEGMWCGEFKKKPENA